MPCLLRARQPRVLPRSAGDLDAWQRRVRPALPARSTTRACASSCSTPRCGTLRGSDWAQLPMLQDALDDAADDPAVKNVWSSPTTRSTTRTRATPSQLGDRKEVALIEKLLSRLPREAGKGVAMVGSHAQIVNVDRVEGVPYMVLPSSGKTPYGTPDRGGFTGWVDWRVDGRRRRPAVADGRRARVRAVDRARRARRPRGGRHRDARAARSSSPAASPRARGSCRCATRCRCAGAGSTPRDRRPVDDARRAGKVASLDPATRELTALRAGDGHGRASTADSMRETATTCRRSATEKTIHVSALRRAAGRGRRRRHGPADAGADARRRRSPSAPSRRASTKDVHGVDHGDGDLDRGRRDADASPAPAGQRRVRARAAARWSRRRSRRGPARSRNDVVAVAFKQKIAATDPLRTGSYSATLTFTLSTTSSVGTPARPHRSCPRTPWTRR